jgi:hypothetical protein
MALGDTLNGEELVSSTTLRTEMLSRPGAGTSRRCGSTLRDVENVPSARWALGRTPVSGSAIHRPRAKPSS